MSVDKDMEDLGLKTCSAIVPVQIKGVIYRDRCPVPVLEGVDLCSKHGGMELVKQEKAALERTVLAQRKRLEEDVLPQATERVLRILNDDEAKDADVINVWKAVMDRVGLAAVQGIVVEGAIQVQAPLDILRGILEGQVVDGEVVDP